MRLPAKFFILFLLIPICTKAQTKLEKRSLLDGKIELLVPSDFKPMSADILNEKYPNRTNQPDVVLTDENAETNIVVSLVNQPLQSAQIPAYKDFQITSLKRIHPDAKWLDNGIKTINGKKVGYFKLISTAVDQTVFNYYFFTNVDGKALIITFNCTEKSLPQWKDTAEAIVSSLVIKK